MATKVQWTQLKPPFRTRAAKASFLKHVRSLVRFTASDEGGEDVLEKLRTRLRGLSQAAGSHDRQVLLAAGLVLTDLAAQGWRLRVRSGEVDSTLR